MQVQLTISDAISHVSQFHFTLDAVPHVQTTTATTTKIFFLLFTNSQGTSV